MYAKEITKGKKFPPGLGLFGVVGVSWLPCLVLSSPLTHSLHPKALQCPAHSLFTNCLPSCLPSCWDPEGLCSGTSHNVPSTCKEGCVCQPGYLLYNDKCVLKIQCGCKDAQGVVISVSGRLKWGWWGMGNSSVYKTFALPV